MKLFIYFTLKAKEKKKKKQIHPKVSHFLYTGATMTFLP